MSGATIPILSGSAARPKQLSMLNTAAKTILLIIQFSMLNFRRGDLKRAKKSKCHRHLETRQVKSGAKPNSIWKVLSDARKATTYPGAGPTHRPYWLVPSYWTVFISTRMPWIVFSEALKTRPAGCGAMCTIKHP